VGDECCRLRANLGVAHLLGRDAECVGELEPEHRVVSVAVLFVPEVVQDQLANLR